jgi:hypothetical protein
MRRAMEIIEETRAGRFVWRSKGGVWHGSTITGVLRPHILRGLSLEMSLENGPYTLLVSKRLIADLHEAIIAQQIEKV